jgi:hypothetical protein
MPDVLTFETPTFAHGVYLLPVLSDFQNKQRLLPPYTTLTVSPAVNLQASETDHSPLCSARG